MPLSLRKLSFDAVLDRLIAMREEHHKDYLAMYSSWYGGIVTDPPLMMVPIDDHLVHRGDGIFEAFKCIGGNVYALNRHLDRLERSTKAVSLALPFSREEIVAIVLETIRAADVTDCMVRLFASRGPGGFTTNPYECVGSQVYVVVATYHATPPEKYERGVTAKTSHVPIKTAYFANVKSCNYLPNVLMRKEAQDSGVDFTISIDENGFLGEGPTENIGIITKEREFLIPRFGRVLHGITVTRIMELARTLTGVDGLKWVGEGDITPEYAFHAAEVMVFGTSFDILPVVSFNGHAIGDGRPGPFFHRFLALIRDDIRTCREMQVPLRSAGEKG